MSERRIKPLDQDVINRIAAGEIIVAPANALKEMLENSIDANASSIDILVKDGGLGLMQITDNGDGIHKDDLPMLCQRFTTSKLSKFEDLSNMQTYGFRGEALASISHIAHLTVTTKREGEPAAWRARYRDGVMLGEPKPVAGNKGTQISVENLFYNVPSRLRALSGKSEEYSKIVEVVGRYAVHWDGIAFTCKRSGETHPTFTVQKTASTQDRIRTMFGSVVANEILPLEVAANEDIGLKRASGFVTNANYVSKKSISPVFFINGRLVSNEPLKRAIASVYTAYLPKGGKSFVYLSLDIEPGNVDVNVHPTKREVRFLFEDEIVEAVRSEIDRSLQRVDAGRTFQTQMILPGVFQVSSDRAAGTQATQDGKRTYEHQLVRTDAKQARLDSFVSTGKIAVERAEDERVPRAVRLESIKSLRRDVEANAHKTLTQVFASHTFVGVADYSRRLAALQHDVNLYLVNYAAVLKELFYQIGLSEFNNYGAVSLGQGVSVRWLVDTALEGGPGDDDEAELPSMIDRGVAQLHAMSEMLADHFQIRLEPVGDDPETPRDLTLTELPLLLLGYVPSLDKLPTFVHHLITKVDWSHERQCFDGILTALALLHIPDPVDNTSEADASERESIASDLETVLFPAVKSRLISPKSLADSVVQIADLPSLYRVFERC